MRLLLPLWLLAAAAALADHHSAIRLDDLAWLTGSWCGANDSATTEEHWLAPHGEVMLGVHRDTRIGGRAFFEFLRIERQEEGIVYLASPAGREATTFPLVEAVPGRVVFANPEHDYPQRIIYRRDGDELTATIEGEISGEERSSVWRWRKDACGFLEPPAGAGG